MNDKPKPIIISEARFEQLLDSQRKLDALEAAGVDNWEGYGEAMRAYYGDSE